MSSETNFERIKTKDGRAFWVEVTSASPLTLKWQLRARDVLDSDAEAEAIYWDDVLIRKTSQLRVNPFRVKWPSPEPLLLSQVDLKAHCAVSDKTLKRLHKSGVIKSDKDISNAFRHLSKTHPKRIAYTADVLRYTRSLSNDAYKKVEEGPKPKSKCRSLSIIVNYRDRPDLMESCLQGIANQNLDAELEVILVNNQSTEESKKEIYSQTQTILESSTKVVHIDYDLPFNKSAQDNIAAKAANGEVIIFYNNDAELLSSDCLQVMADWALEPDVCCTGPRILGDKDRLVSNGVFAREASGNQPDIIRENELSAFEHCIRPSVGISFACAAVSKAAFEEVGPLDEEIFKSQYNDADFFIRALRLGKSHIHIGGVTCRHEPGASESRTKEKTMALLAKFREHYPEIGSYSNIDVDGIKLKRLPVFPPDAKAANRDMDLVRRWRKVQPYAARINSRLQNLRSSFRLG